MGNSYLCSTKLPAMLKGFFNVPTPVNEPVLNYGPRSVERAALQAELQLMRSTVTDIPMYIGNKEVRTGKTLALRPPHDHQHLLANYHDGDASHVTAAIDAALNARADWENLPLE